MGFRQASGTKPSNLAAPVPGDQPVNDQAALAGIKAPPMGAPPQDDTSSQAPAPSGSPAPVDPLASLDAGAQQPPQDPTAQQPQAQATAEDPLAHLDSQPQTPPNHFDSLKGQDVEGKFAGFDVKVSKDGLIQMKSPLSDSWKAPTESQVDAARAMYSTILNAGTTAGTTAGGALGAMAGPAGAVAIGAAGGAIGGKFNNVILDHMKANPDTAKFLYLLQKVGGNDESETPLGPGASALLGAASPLASTLIGSLANKVGTKLATAATTADAVTGESASLFNSEIAPQMDKIAAASDLTGIPVSAAEAMAPYSAKAASALRDVKDASVFGKDAVELYNLKATQKQNALKGYLGDLINKIAPGTDWEKPSELAIAQTAKKGFGESSIVDKAVSGIGKIVQMNNDEASEAAGSRLFSLDNLHAKQIDLMRSQSPRVADALQSGNIAEASQILKKNSGSDKNLGSLFDAIVELNSEINESHAVASINPDAAATQLSSAAPASGQVKPTLGGADYDWIDSYTNRIQRQAKDEKNSLLQQAAGNARSHQTDVLSNIFKDDPDKVHSFQDANRIYSQNIQPLLDLKKDMISGKADIGGAVLHFDAPTIRMIKSIGFSDEELSQFRGAALNAGLRDQLALDPAAGLSPAKIQNAFFKGSRREAMTELFGSDTADKLDAVVTLAKTLDKPNIKTAANEAAADKAFHSVLSLKGVLGGLSNAAKAVGNIFSTNEEVSSILQSKVADYKNFAPKASDFSEISNLGKSMSDAATAPTSRLRGATKSLIGSELQYRAGDK